MNGFALLCSSYSLFYGCERLLPFHRISTDERDCGSHLEHGESVLCVEEREAVAADAILQREADE